MGTGKYRNRKTRTLWKSRIVKESCVLLLSVGSTKWHQIPTLRHQGGIHNYYTANSIHTILATCRGLLGLGYMILHLEPRLMRPSKFPNSTSSSSASGAIPHAGRWLLVFQTSQAYCRLSIPSDKHGPYCRGLTVHDGPSGKWAWPITPTYIYIYIEC